MRTLQSQTATTRRATSVALRSNYVLLLGPLCAGMFMAIVGCETQQLRTEEDYRHQYSKPLLSSGTQFALLPPAVQNTIRAETGSANIEQVVKDDSFGRVVYTIYFQNSNWFQPLLVAADGSLLDPDLIVAIGAPKEDQSAGSGSASSSMSLNDLPAAAVTAIQRRAPDAQVDTVIRQVSGNQVVYIVTFKDRLHAPLQVTADGTITPETPPQR